MTDTQRATVDEKLISTPVGQRIRARRVELGLSQAEIAEGMLSPSYVSLVESGRRQPAASALAHIAERLRIDVEYLRDGVDASVRTQARLSLGRAEMALRDGRADEAYQQFTELVDAPGLSDDQVRRARLGRALARERSGDLEGALALLVELADEARENPGVNPWLDVAEALTRCYREAGDLDMAVQVGDEAMRSAVEVGLEGSDEHVRLGCTVLGAYYERGDLVRANALASTLMTLADTRGAPHTRGAAYWNASIVAESRGETAQALVLVERALAMFGESDDTRNLARLRVAYAWLLMQEPEPRAADALRLLDDVEAQITAHGSAVEVSSFNTERARAYLALARVDEALESVEAALAKLGDRPRIETARARLLRARILRQQGTAEDAALECAAAAQTLESMGASRQAAAAWRELADLYRDLGRVDEAMNSYDRALRAVRVAPAAATGIVNLAEADPLSMLGLESV